MKGPLPESKSSLVYDIWKRTIDVSSSLFVLVLFSPLLLLIAIAIKMDSSGPVIYKAKRVGKGGKVFGMWKFRSMIFDADEFLMKHPKYMKVFKKKEGWKFSDAGEDPRITRVGRFTRKYSFDELPNLWNILVGDMSMIGPRAYRKDSLGDEIEEQLSLYPGLRQKLNLALSIKPGLSGPWQTSGRNKLAWDRRVELDAEYASKRSIWVDILILLKTPLAMLNRW